MAASAAGALLAVAGVLLAVRSALLLHARGRPRRGPQPAFVIAGPYRRVRNPLFAGVLLSACGAAVVARSLVAGLGTMLVAVIAHTWVVGVEEPRLRDRFGPAYAAYLRCVPRWVPRLARAHDAT